MIVSDSAPTKTVVIAATAYKAAGFENQTFQIAEPFTPDNFSSLADSGVNVEGFAKQINSLFVTRISSAMTALVKSVVESNAKSNDEPADLPTQSDLDSIIAKYDFSGVRGSGEKKPARTAFDKIWAKHARDVVRGMLEKFGYNNEEAGLTLSVPAKVAKKDDPKPNGKVPYDLFMEEIRLFIEGENVWASPEEGGEEKFFTYRESLLEAARTEAAAAEAAVRLAAARPIL